MEIRRTIRIEAPAERSWSVISDIERWPEWTPSVKRVQRHDEGPLRVGTSATLDLRGGTTSRWTVSDVAEGRSFTWSARIGPAMRFTADHIVEPEGAGCRLTLVLTPSGALGTVMAPLLLAMSRRNVDAEARGAAARAESPDYHI